MSRGRYAAEPEASSGKKDLASKMIGALGEVLISVGVLVELF